MKKIFIFVFSVILLCNGFAKNSERFAKYIDSSYFNADFYKENPMLLKYINFINIPTYFPNLDAIKNKIVLTTYEPFYIHTDGSKYSDDNDSYITLYGYSVFNENGQLVRTYYIEYDLVFGPIKTSYTNYTYTQDKYLEETFFAPFTKEKTDGLKEEYIIREEDNKLFFETVFGKKNSLARYCFTKDKIIYTENTNNVITYKEEYSFFENKLDCVIYNNKGNIKKLYSYEKGKERRKTNLSGSKTIIETYFLDDQTKGKYTWYEYTNNKITQKREQYLERRYNKDGFLEYDCVRPFKDGEPGRYIIYTTKILDKPDEFFLEYFGDVM